MFIYDYNGKRPKIAASALIAPNVTIIGDVEIGEHCSIWPGVVIRSDTTPIRIGNNVHIEDNSVLHTSTHIEDNVMIGHGCTIEAFIGHDTMIGNTASLMPLSRIGCFLCDCRRQRRHRWQEHSRLQFRRRLPRQSAFDHRFKRSQTRHASGRGLISKDPRAWPRSPLSIGGRVCGHATEAAGQQHG